MGYNAAPGIVFTVLMVTLSLAEHVSWRTYTSHTPVFQVLYSKDSDSVLVGGRNMLFRLDRHLGLISSVRTGPVEDSPLCPPYPLACESRHVTDNDVKIMLFWHEPWMLVCGSVNQGMCHFYTTENLTASESVGLKNETSSYVAGNGTVVALLTKGKDLYTARSFDDRDMKFFDSTISCKVIQGDLQEHLRVHYAYKRSTSVTALSFHRDYVRSTPVNYIYGFSYGKFHYFLLTQRTREDTYETRLARICDKDLSFFSYSEVPIVCQDERGFEYNLGTAALLGPFLKSAKDVFYVAFGKNEKDQEPLHKYGSVLCLFPMSHIEVAFANATRDCFQSRFKGRRIKKILGNENSCTPKISRNLEADMCEPGINHYIEGSVNVKGEFLVSTEEVTTSLAVTSQNDVTVAFLGSKNGTIAKFVLKDQQEFVNLYKVPVDPESRGNGFEVRSSFAFDTNEENLYLLSGNKVVQFPARSCSLYSTCQACVSSQDPLECGWCGDRCDTRKQCQHDTFLQYQCHPVELQKVKLPTGPCSSYATCRSCILSDESLECGWCRDLCSTEKECHFQTFLDNQCPPIVHKIIPASGGLKGGTRIIILGENFKSLNSNKQEGKLTVSVAGLKCNFTSWNHEKIICFTRPSASVVSGLVIVTVRNQEDDGLYINGTGYSVQKFSYVSPKLFGISPAYGPMSGGTNVTLVGEGLNAGSNLTVLLAGSLCTVTSKDDNHIDCTTSTYSVDQYQNRSAGAVLVCIDKEEVEPEPQLDPLQRHLEDSYVYRADPEILDVFPKSTIFSGGTDVIVTGHHLDSVSRPRMVVTITHSASAFKSHVEQDCVAGELPGTSMVCRTPSLVRVPSAGVSPTGRVAMSTHIHFLMDCEACLKNRPAKSPLLYYRDPVLLPFPGNVTVVRTDTLEMVIEGESLSLVLGPEDYVISINKTFRCNVTQLTDNSLQCILPKELNSTSLQEPLPVQVHAGNLEFNLGGMTLASPSHPFRQPWEVIAAASTTSVFLLAIVFFVLLYKTNIFRKKGKRRVFNDLYADTETREKCIDSKEQVVKDIKIDEDEESKRVKRATLVEETMKLLLMEKILLSRKHLTLDKEIGIGNFGRVYRGHLQLPDQKEQREVAVKTLRNHLCQDMQSFLQEGFMMKDFHHCNVLNLIGVCFEDSGSPMVVLPFMKNGDLKTYVQDETNEPTVRQLIEFGIQVGQGMEYLSNLKFVHRDLAARNCMLDEYMIVKVADFGLSRDVYEREYYSSDNKKSKLPVKWMAPESLEKGTYTTKCDVWSFGVLLWELMTRGVIPYPEVGNWEILQYIKSGRRMLRPSYCPTKLYQMMVRCWHSDPQKRPTFAESVIRMKNILKKMDSTKKKVGLDGTYVNCAVLTDPV